MFKSLILQAQHNLSDARMEFMIRDRLPWTRLLGFDLGEPTPDESLEDQKMIQWIIFPNKRSGCFATS